MILFGTVSLILVIALFLYKKETTGTGYLDSYTMRSYDLVLGLKIFLERPIFGFGYMNTDVFHNSECRYKVLGYRITFEGETLYVFDLLVPEIFHERQKRKEETVAEQPADQETKPVDTRKGFYPDDIAGTFGVPVEEHLRESEVR